MHGDLTLRVISGMSQLATITCQLPITARRLQQLCYRINTVATLLWPKRLPENGQYTKDSKKHNVAQH